MLTEFFWREYMSLYDRGVGGLFPYQCLLDELIDASDITDGMRVVDAGCGTGNLITRLRTSPRPFGALYAVERDRHALQLARDKNIGSSIEFIQGDLDEDGWAAGLGAIDVVFSCNVIYALRDPDHFLRTVFKMLKPGGRLVATSIANPVPELIFGAHDRWLKDVATEAERQKDAHEFAPARAKVIAMNQLIAKEMRGKPAHVWNTGLVREHLLQAGLRPVLVREDAYAGANFLFVAKK